MMKTLDEYKGYRIISKAKNLIITFRSLDDDKSNYIKLELIQELQNQIKTSLRDRIQRTI